MSRMLTNLLKLVFLVVMIGVIGYLGACVYGNFFQAEPGDYKEPSIDRAKYEVIIKNSGNTFYSASVESEGTVHTLDGYWEVDRNKYRYRDIVLALDEDIFGPITVKLR